MVIVHIRGRIYLQSQFHTEKLWFFTKNTWFLTMFLKENFEFIFEKSPPPPGRRPSAEFILKIFDPPLWTKFFELIIKNIDPPLCSIKTLNYNCAIRVNHTSLSLSLFSFHIQPRFISDDDHPERSFVPLVRAHTYYLPLYDDCALDCASLRREITEDERKMVRIRLHVYLEISCFCTNFLDRIYFLNISSWFWAPSPSEANSVFLHLTHTHTRP